MTNYQLKIRSYNLPAHLDIEKAIEERRNGDFTFTLRVNAGNIVECNITDYVNVKQKYGIVNAVLIEKYSFTSGDRE